MVQNIQQRFFFLLLFNMTKQERTGDDLSWEMEVEIMSPIRSFHFIHVCK